MIIFKVFFYTLILSAYYLLLSISFNRGKLLWVDYNIIEKFSGLIGPALHEEKESLDILTNIKEAEDFIQGMRIVFATMLLILVIIPLCAVLIAFIWPVSFIGVGASILVLHIQNKKDD